MVAPHEPALESVEAGVRRRSGAVVIGPAGVGKTTLLRAAAERLGLGGSVTASDAAIPVGAFRRLIDLPATGKSAAIVRAAPQKLRPGCIQLGLTGTASLVVSVAAGTPVPAPLAALWEDGLLARIDLQPAGHDDTRVAARSSPSSPISRRRPGTRWSTWRSAIRCRRTSYACWPVTRP